jgi:hypothetical protein
MISQLSRALVGYYVALRISAGAVTTWLPFEPRADPSPIVRASRQQFQGGFDIREIVGSPSRPHVVTLPASFDSQPERQRQYPILPN